MNFQEARNAWRSITEQIDEARIHAHRVMRDPLPVNNQDVLVMREQLASPSVSVVGDVLRGLLALQQPPQQPPQAASFGQAA